MNWDLDYFEREYLEEYGTGHISEERTQAEAKFVLETLSLRSGARILDLCCGYGRHAVGMAAQGFDVVALDRSQSLLDHAAELAARRGVRITTMKQDARRLSFAKEFDAVISVFTSYGYNVSEEDDLTMLKGVAAALVPGGKFLIDLDNAARVLGHFQQQDWRQLANGGYILNSRRYDAFRGRVEGRRIRIDPQAEPREYEMSIRLYAYSELVRQLTTVGITPITAYGDFDGRPYDSESPRMIVTAASQQS